MTPSTLLTHAAENMTDRSLCDNKTLQMQSLGHESAVLVQLRPRLWLDSCSFLVLSPSENILTIQLVPSERSPSDGGESRDDCKMQVRIPDSLEVVSELDLCNSSSLNMTVVLISQEPKYQFSYVISSTISRKASQLLQASGILFTEISIGSYCVGPDKVPCLTEGNMTLACVAPELMCDGLANCPGNTLDEDEDMCHRKELLDITGNPNKMDPDQYCRDKKADMLMTEMLPLLLSLTCAALILGLCLRKCWECCCCCCSDSPSQPDGTAGVFFDGSADEPTVFLLSPASGVLPRYDDLEHLPSYTALFPDLEDIPEKSPVSPC